MTNLQNNIENAIFDKYLENAKLEVITDISFGYRYEDDNTVLDLYQDEKGKNHIEEFSVLHNGIWFSMMANDYQLKAIWGKLNSTSLAFETIIDEEEPIRDLYDYFGVQPSNFY